MKQKKIATAIVAAILGSYVPEFTGFQHRFLELERQEAK